MKKRFSLLLAVLLLLSAFGCSNNPAAENEPDAQPGGAPAAEETAPAETEPETLYPPDDLPDGLSFDGTTVNVFGWSGPSLVEFYVEEQNGEIVNDAIYARNLAVEERLGITLAYRLEPGAYDQRNDWVRVLGNSISVGDGAYDISGGYSMAGASLASKGMCVPLNDLDYLDFSKPWWPASLLDEATCGGKLYFCSGDISTYMIYYLYGVYFNQDMLAEYEGSRIPTTSCRAAPGRSTRCPPWRAASTSISTATARRASRTGSATSPTRSTSTRSSSAAASARPRRTRMTSPRSPRCSAAKRRTRSSKRSWRW
ncbi:MAG: hypothetical protein IKQ87_06305, partial [Clostridia bacterium]|nr:hypothetical protein [Clostridia bacterium]